MTYREKSLKVIADSFECSSMEHPSIYEVIHPMKKYGSGFVYRKSIHLSMAVDGFLVDIMHYSVSPLTKYSWDSARLGKKFEVLMTTAPQRVDISPWGAFQDEVTSI